MQLRSLYNRFLSTWLYPLLLAATSLLCWIFLFRTPVSKQSTHKEAAPILSLHKTMLNQETEHVLWSPNVFALPSSVGFNQPIALQPQHITPPTELTPTKNFTLENSNPADIEELSALAKPGIQNDLSYNMLETVNISEKCPIFTLQKNKEPYVIFHKPWQAEDFQFAELALPKHDEPLETSCYIESDSFGNISHVFVEKSSGDSSWDDAVIHMLKRWRLATPKKQQGYLTVCTGNHLKGDQPL